MFIHDFLQLDQFNDYTHVYLSDRNNHLMKWDIINLQENTQGGLKW